MFLYALTEDGHILRLNYDLDGSGALNGTKWLDVTPMPTSEVTEFKKPD